MSVSNIRSSQSVSNSSGSEEEKLHFSLKAQELSREVFSERFGNCKGVSRGEFTYSAADEGEILSFNSIAFGDCITMFGIGSDRSLFAWNFNSTQVNEEMVLEELEQYFNDYDENVRNTQFDIYLVGGNGSEFSGSLYTAMVSAIHEFFHKPFIVGELINPTQDREALFITANFNTYGQFFYYLHNEQPHATQSESSTTSSSDFLISGGGYWEGF
jgi:hypothetical protein